MNIDLYFYWKMLLRRLPIMALLVTLCTGLGVFSAMRLPETFSTSARLLVEEPQIPDSMVASTVQTEAVEQLDIIQQRLLTRANLIDIANRYDVYEDLGLVDPDTIVRRMQQDTSIRRSAGRSQATLMTISFNGRSAQIVANVVNEYVTLVLETNIDFRMSRAENTLEFFTQEVSRLDAELNEQSVRISTFKSENAQALPEDQSFRLGRQALLQERLALLERDLRSAIQQKEDISNIFANTGQVAQGNQQRPMSPEESQLLVARSDLDQALLTYSETNPRVVRLQAAVERLEAIVASQNQVIAENQNSEAMTPQEAMFEATILEIDNRIETIETDLERTQAELATLQEAISASAANGIELTSLERDFAAIQSRYDAAVRNLNEARMSERIETGAQGQRISVIENANVPSSPSGPNRPRVMALGAAVGLALAGGFFALLELLNRSIRRPAELISKFNVTPLTIVPYLETPGRRTVRRLGLIAATLIVVIGVPLVLWYIDTNYMPLDLLVTRVLSRFGIM